MRLAGNLWSCSRKRGARLSASVTISLVCFISLGHFTAVRAAESYPNKPITILIGFAVGGGSDTAARIQGEAMSKILGVPITVRNVPGAGGRNAVTLLERAAPDGYTMAALNVPGQIVNQTVRGMKPDLRKFVWLGRQIAQRYFIQASKKSGFKSLADLKKATKPVRAGITGTGGNTFPISVIATEIIGYPVRFVAGFTGPELVTAIIRGDIDITTLPLVSAFVTAVDSGEAVSLGVYGPGNIRYGPTTSPMTNWDSRN